MTDQPPQSDPTKPMPATPQAAEPEEPPYDPTVPIVQKTEDGGRRMEDAQAPSGYPTAPPPNPTAGQGSAAKGDVKSQKSKVKSGDGALKVRRPFPVWILWIVALIALGTAGFFLFFWRGTIAVTVTPPEATIILAETSSTGQQTKTLSPGTYTVHAEAPGYISFDSKVILKRQGQEKVEIALKPAPVPAQLSQQHIQFMSLSSDKTSLLYLEPNTKTVYRLRFDDPTKPVIDAITPNRLDNVGEFGWSPDRQLALLRQGDTLKLYDFNRYDLVNQTVTDWPGEVKAIDWRPDGAKVAYFFSDAKTGERTLIRATKDNDGIERIYNFGSSAITNPKLTWSPDAKSIAFVEKNLFVLDVFSKTLKQLNVPGPIKSIRWSPTSDRILFETGADKIGLIGLDGEVSRLNVPGPITRAAFKSDGKTLIHASGRGSAFKLASINLDSLEQTTIPTPMSKDLAADNLLLGKDDSQLFFTSAGQPYLLQL